jgi:hypothetical protein
MMDDFIEQVENDAELLEYFGLLASSKESLHETTTLSQLASVTRLMAIKSKYNFSVSCYNDLVDLILDMRNVRVGLATDGFTPFNSNVAPYSCWLVIKIRYNLPPSLCIKDEYVFLTLIIPGPDNPDKRLNMFMQPLIDELHELWNEVRIYDSSRKKYFNMRVVFLWSIHNFPTYGMFSGWGGARTVVYVVRYAWVIQILFV